MPLNKEVPHQLTTEEVSQLTPGFRALADDYIKHAKSIATTSTYAQSMFLLATRNRLVTDHGVKPGMAEVLCAVASIPMTTLVHAHTLIPFSGAILAVVNGDWCGKLFIEFARKFIGKWRH